MARKKVKLAWIANNSIRHATLRKRRNGLLKKASELSILCGIKACAVIYDPEKPEPEVWPSRSEAMRILQDFKAMPECGQDVRRVDQEGFLRQRNAKLCQQLLRQQVQNKQLEMKALMVQGMAGTQGLKDMGFEDAVIMRRMIDGTATEVRQRIGAAKAQAVVAETKEGVENDRLMDGASVSMMYVNNPSRMQNVPSINSSGSGFDNVMQPNIMQPNVLNNGSGDPWMHPAVWMQPYILNNWMDPPFFPFAHL